MVSFLFTFIITQSFHAVLSLWGKILITPIMKIRILITPIMKITMAIVVSSQRMLTNVPGTVLWVCYKLNCVTLKFMLKSKPPIRLCLE